MLLCYYDDIMMAKTSSYILITLKLWNFSKTKNIEERNFYCQRLRYVKRCLVASKHLSQVAYLPSLIFHEGGLRKKTAFNSPASNKQLGVFITFKTFKMLQAFEN